MTSFSTAYMGLQLASPIVVSSIPLNSDPIKVAEMEAQGAGAVILPSLFEEQIHIAEAANHHMRFLRADSLPASLRPLMELDGFDRGVSGYLALIHYVKQAVKIPVIASLNGTSPSGWTRYARLLAGAGADAIELNLYNLATYKFLSGQDVEDNNVELVKAIKASINVPFAVKISPFVTALPNYVERLQAAGADAIVIFNRFYQPEFNLETESVVSHLKLSTPAELNLRLRWAALLYGKISAEIGITGGVHTGDDALKSILAGGQVAMVGSTVLKNGVSVIGDILTEMRTWMEAHNYSQLSDIRGKFSPDRGHNSPAYERANYILELDTYRKQYSNDNPSD